MHKPTALSYTAASGSCLVTAHPSQVGEVWPVVGPMLARAVAMADSMTLGDVRGQLDRGEQQLWMSVSPDGVIEGAWTTRIANYPGKRVCEIVLCGGNAVERWLEMIEPVEWFAREMGCQKVRIFGRAGWLKVLKGFTEAYRVIERDL